VNLKSYLFVLFQFPATTYHSWYVYVPSNKTNQNRKIAHDLNEIQIMINVTHFLFFYSEAFQFIYCAKRFHNSTKKIIFVSRSSRFQNTQYEVCNVAKDIV
jgi:hypothetical protein